MPKPNTQSMKRMLPKEHNKANVNSEVVGSKIGQGLGNGQRRGPVSPTRSENNR